MSAAPTLSLTQRLVRAAQFPGYHGIQVPKVIENAELWEADAGLAGPQLRHATARLDRLGFRGGARETLFPNRRGSTEIVSLVERFRSAADARTELADRQAPLLGTTVPPAVAVRSFRVAGIPGATGTETLGPTVMRRSVSFAAGLF